MKHKKLSLYVFIDALGWELIKEGGFCKNELPYQYKVRTQFGYSAAAVPTILSGQTPDKHNHFSFFYFDPKSSPFRFFRFFPKWFSCLSILKKHRVRNKLSSILKRILGFTGYFQLYSVPFAHLPCLNYSEKQDIFAAGGLKPCQNLKDAWCNRTHLISNWRKKESENYLEMFQMVKENKIECGFLYMAALDGFLHQNISNPEKVKSELEQYQQRIQSLFLLAKEKYQEVEFCVMSDHGMTPLEATIDLQVVLKNYIWGKDYVSVMDSTMARFWWLNPAVKKDIMDTINACEHGHFLSQDELIQWGINFPHAQYGESFYLLDPGYQIVPSDMGTKPLSGMHGYTPDTPSSDAIFLSNIQPQKTPQWIGDFFHIMTTQTKDL